MPTGVVRRIGAEFVGTGILAAAVIGSGIMAAKLAGGNAALALLCNALATGAVLVALMTALGPVSGAHLNPVVTMVIGLRGEMPADEAVPYVAAQIVGGVLGAFAAHAMFDLPIFQLSSTARTGTAQWFAEIVAAFGLLATIVGCIRFRPSAIASSVGLYILSAYWFTASTSFANPALTIARSLTDTFAGISPYHVFPFILAQMFGAALGAVVMEGLAGWRLTSHREN